MALEHQTVRLAELVADGINSATFGWSARRAWLPIWDRVNLNASLGVLVVPKTENTQPVARRATQGDRAIWLVIRKPLSQGNDDTFNEGEIDEVFRQVQRLEDYLEFRNFGEFHWIGTETDQLYDHDHLMSHREFFGVRSVNYRTVR